MDNILQAYIILMSGGAAYCVSRTDGAHRWGHVMGLLSQPAYIYVTWKAGMWGVFFMALYYTWTWSRGVWFRFRSVS